jgi:hypothetical protein
MTTDIHACKKYNRKTTLRLREMQINYGWKKQTDGRRSFKWAEKKKYRQTDEGVTNGQKERNADMQRSILLSCSNRSYYNYAPAENRRVDLYIYPVITDMSFMQK